MLAPSPPRSAKDRQQQGSHRRLRHVSATEGRFSSVLERERQLAAHERQSWARFEGAAPEPSLVGDTAASYDPYSLGTSQTPPRPLRHLARRTRRSLDDELQAALGSRTPADPDAPLTMGTGADALADLDPFDRALVALSTGVPPWAPGHRAHLSLCDYTEFRFVAESFRRWRTLAADQRKHRLDYSWALRRYKVAMNHHRRDLLARGWVSWEVGRSRLQIGGGPVM